MQNFKVKNTLFLEFFHFMLILGIVKWSTSVKNECFLTFRYSKCKLIMITERIFHRN